ncbi:hypothetical protein BC827DRAFT_1380252 [Russula dissimulans]|nr:hypothetical protein BC827DRAFT_1380252 [Russula dissimulans]
MLILTTVAPLDSSERTIRPKKVEQPGGLASFLQLATLPSHTIALNASTQTHPYNTLSASISESGFPFIAINSQDMASSMFDDLFARVLPKYHVVDLASLDKAKNLAAYYTQDVAGGSMEIGHEPSVWRVTHRVLDTCIIFLGAVGQRFQLKTEVLNNCANVRMDSVVQDTQGGMVLAVEDKSPMVFGKHCTQQEVEELCGTPLHMDEIEEGFRSIILSPAPPEIVGSRDAGFQTRSHKAQLFAPTPEDLTTMILHTTAAAGRLRVDIPMMRVDKMQTLVTHVRSADVYVKDFLGAGSFGRVFLAEVFIHNLCYGQVVEKLANVSWKRISMSKPGHMPSSVACVVLAYPDITAISPANMLAFNTVASWLMFVAIL